MSYASVASQNVPPSSEQPHPDPALLNTEPPSADNIVDEATKVNLVAPDFKDNLTTVSHSDVPNETYGPFTSGTSSGAPSTQPRTAREKARRYVRGAEQEGFHLWRVTKDYLLRPAVAGGLIGLVNIGLISGIGYTYYACPHLRRDAKALTSTVAAGLAVFGAEGYLAESYRNTPAGREEERKTKAEGAALYRHGREHLLRPGVLGGMFGILNAGILGSLGYIAYINWNVPRWDRRTVSAISVSLITLWAGEGYIADQYRKSH